MLHVHALDKSYATPQGPQPVLRGVDLSVAAGETVALVGESGSGKSTLLHLIAGLDAADAGTIQVGEAEVTALDDAGRAALRRDRIGVVFQQFNLAASLRVGDNLALQARLAGREDPAWTAELAARLGLSDLLTRYPEQLSGGQQQRVAVGRALAVRPALALADEPTGNLDAAAGDAVLGLFLELAQDAGSTLVMATHSDRVAAKLDRVVRIEDGRLVSPSSADPRAGADGVAA